MDKKKLSFKDIMINYGVIIIVVLLVIYTGITSKNFLSVNNLTNILMNMSSRLVIALGIAGCIITAGCDLSAGRMIGLGGCIAGTLLQKMDYSQKFFPDMKPMNIFLALLIVMLICAVFGAVTGFHRLSERTALHFHHGNDGDRLRYQHDLHQRNSAGWLCILLYRYCFRQIPWNQLPDLDRTSCGSDHLVYL